MPRIESTIRPYDVLLAPHSNIEPSSNEEVNALFALTADWYNRTGETFLNLFLSLSGSITPEIVKVISERDPAIICAMSWFTLESVDCGKPLLNTKQMKKKFHEYWSALSDDVPNIDLLLDFNYYADRYAYVDRRKEFAELNKKLHLTPQDIELFFTTPAFSYFGAEEGSPYFWRTYFSNVFGTGKKADQGQKANAFQQLFDHKKLWTSKTVGDLRQHAFKCFKVESMEDFKTQSGFNRGASNFFIKKLERADDSVISDKELDTLKKQIQERTLVLQTAMDRPAYSPAIKTLQTYLEDKIGIPFTLEQYAKAAQLAWRRIISSKNLAFDQLANKQADAEKENKLNGEFVKVLMEFEQFMSKKLGIPSYEVRIHQFNGIEEVCAQAKDNVNFEDALSAAQQSLDGKKFGHHELFRYLHEQGVINPKVDHKHIIESAQKLALIRKIQSLRLGGVRHISAESPVKPEFGASSPTIKLHSTPIHDVEVLNAVTLNLWNGKEFVNVTDIPVFGKRAKREVFFRNPTAKKTVFRNNNLNYDEKANVLSDLLAKGQCGAHLFTNNQYWEDSTQLRWYLRLAPKLDYEKTYMPKLGETELRVLSVDIGWKNPAAYAVLKTNKNANVGNIIGKNKEGDVLYRASFEECGTIEHKLMHPETNEYYSLFEPAGRKVNKEQREMGEVYLSKIFDKDFILDHDTDLLHMLYLISTKIKSFIYKTGPNKTVLDMLKNVIRTVSPKFMGELLNSNSGNTQHHSGTLSWKRIDLITNLISASSSYLSLLAKENKPTNIEVEEAIKRMRTKLTAIRTERYRVTASMIMKKAKELKVNCVVLRDDESLRVSRGNFASDNQKISRWYSSRIYRQVEENLMTIGIFVDKVDPPYLSHQDLDDTSVVVYTEYTPSKKMNKFEERLRNRFNAYQTIKTPGPIQTLYIDAMNKLFKKHGVDNFDQLRKKLLKEQSISIRIPYREGAVAVSRCMKEGKTTVVSTDELAAAIIGKRFLNKLGYIRLKKGAKKAA